MRKNKRRAHGSPAPMIGINCSALEQGTPLPGVYGSDYENIIEAADPQELKRLYARGIRVIRVPFLWERLQRSGTSPNVTPGSVALDAAYLGRIKLAMDRAWAAGLKVVPDLHNYGRYNSGTSVQNSNAAADYPSGNNHIIGRADGSSVPVTTVHLQDVWTKLATELKSHPALLAYDIMNEPHDMDVSTRWFDAAQAAINGIRSVDGKTEIWVEGNTWSHASSWGTDSNTLQNLVDPAKNLRYSAHLYFDSDEGGNSGQTWATASAAGVTTATGLTRLAPFVTWLAANGKKGCIGETGVSIDDANWQIALGNMMARAIAKDIPVALWWYSRSAGSDPMNLYYDASGADTITGPQNPSWAVIQRFLKA